MSFKDAPLDAAKVRASSASHAHIDHDGLRRRQRSVLNWMQDHSNPVTTSIYAELAKCSTDTALRDIRELLASGWLAKNQGGGRSTSYRLEKRTNATMQTPHDVVLRPEEAAASAVEAYRKRIIAAERVYDVANRTPVHEAPLLSQRLGNTVLLKREDLQPVFSFKLRGAYNKIASLPAAKRRRGVVAASAGNHAQGVALAADRLGIAATIVMPKGTPRIKIDAVRARGATAVLHGDFYEQASEHARKLAATSGACFIPPYDDATVIAGQGTIGREIDEQCPRGEDAPDAVFVPVGGGGVLAGIAAWLHLSRPEIEVYGVEPQDAACLAAALAAGRRVKLAEVGVFAEGAAVAQVGREPFRVVRAAKVAGVLTVSTDEICAAVKDIFDDTRSLAEPSGALALAGLKRFVAERGCSGQRLLALHSGANLNFDRLATIAERAELGERREAVMSVALPEENGAFLRFCHCLGERNISELNYRRSDGRIGQLFVGLTVDEREGEDVRAEIRQELRDQGFAVNDLNDNELAKQHVRHMIGGARQLEDEVLYRVQFPERPQALLDFLSGLAPDWSVTLFHYGSQGATYGQVLIGLQVPKRQRGRLRKCLSRIGFPHHEETDNAAYQDFLGEQAMPPSLDRSASAQAVARALPPLRGNRQHRQSKRPRRAGAPVRKIAR